jgi:hypothetical protein
MPLFHIRRDIGQISQEELDAAAVRAILCAPQFTGMKWQRSFLDRKAGRLDCYYEAASASDVRDHARVARIPCDDVWEVEEVLPQPYLHG